MGLRSYLYFYGIVIFTLHLNSIDQALSKCKSKWYNNHLSLSSAFPDVGKVSNSNDWLNTFFASQVIPNSVFLTLFNLTELLTDGVQFSRSVVSGSKQPYGWQHARLPCPSPTPGACSNSCPLSHWCHPTISSSVIPFSSHLQSFPASGSFPSESVLLIRWPQHWSFSFSISPSNEYSGLISFRMDWLDLLSVQGTLKSLHQHHSSKASILLRSAFFMIQLSHPYASTGKTLALTRLTFVGKVMSLRFI